MERMRLLLVLAAGRDNLRWRFLAGVGAAATVGLLSATTLPAMAATATTLTPLGSETFTGASTPVGQWVLPAAFFGTNQACLTAAGSGATSIPRCSPATDAAPGGALQLNSSAHDRVGSVFNTAGLPTSQGLDVKFDLYQFGAPSGTGGPAGDGLSFDLAATDPAHPVPPTSTGPLGGSLGYAANAANGESGLPHGYLGVGFDVYGNYLNSASQGSGCTNDTSDPTSPQAVTARGAGNGTAGYCVLASSAGTTPSGTNNLGGDTLDTPGSTTRSTGVPVELAMNPTASSATTASGLTVGAQRFVVSYTPVGATAPQTLTGSLQSLTANASFPSSWINPATGAPWQLTFGWTASTANAYETHEVANFSASTLTGPLPVLTATNTDSTSGVLTGGTSSAFTIQPTVSPTAGDETDPVSVTDTFPAGLLPGQPSGTGWTCGAPSNQTVTCAYPASSASPLTAGTVLPAIAVPVLVSTAAASGPATDTATASSDDASTAVATDSYTVEQRPGAPTGVSATPGNAQASVAFSAPASDGGSAITSYTVTATDTTTPAHGGQTATATSSPITVNGLTNGDSYTFTVTAANTVGISSPSPASTTVAPAATAPGAPTGVSATPGNAQASVAFSAPASDGGSAITSYTVTATDTTTPAHGGQTATATSSPITVNGLTNGDSYTFTVTAANTVGISSPSPASTTVAPAGPPAPPVSSATPVFSADSPSSAAAGSPYSYTFVASGIPTPTFAVGSGALPAGLALDPTTGVLSGTPTASGTFTVTATNSAGTATTPSVTVTVTTPPVTTPPSGPAAVREPTGGAVAATPGGAGYWALDGNGTLSTHGNAADLGSENGARLNAPIIGVSATADGHGYWLVAADGGVFSFGDAKFYGSEGDRHLNQPIVGMAATPDGYGYWLVAADGGVFTFGDAKFYGSEGDRHLNQPIVGMAATPDGYGYWLVAADGGVFTFGDAKFYGSEGDRHLNQPIVGMAATPDGYGYWLVAADGGVFTLGDAKFYGSLGAPGTTPVVGIVANSDSGYRLIGAQGDAHAFGNNP